MFRFNEKYFSPGKPGGFSLAVRLVSRISLVLILAASIVSNASGWVDSPTVVESKDFGDGLVYSVYKHANTGTFYFLKVKCDSAKYRVIPTINQNGITKNHTVKQAAITYDSKAMASINASFFDEAHYPIGTVGIDGHIVSLDNRERTSLGINTDGSGVIGKLRPRGFVTPDDYFEPIWLWGYNHPTRKNSIIGYNKHYGKSLITLPSDAKSVTVQDGKVLKMVDSGNVSISGDNQILVFRGKSLKYLDRFKIGSVVTLGLVMPDEWKNASAIVTGGPRIIDNARIVDFTKHSEGFPSTIFKKHRRTIAGLTWNNEFFMALFPGSVSFETAAEVLMEINVKDAMGFDGGSSSCLWVNGVKSFNGSKKVPVSLSVVSRDKENPAPLPYFENKYWR